MSALTRAKFARLLKGQAEERKLDRFYDFAVFRRDTGEFVGKVAVMDVIRGLGQQPPDAIFLFRLIARIR